MDDAELQRLIQEMTDGIAELSNREEPLTKAERKRKRLLQMKQETLLKIKQAREADNFSQEVSLLTTYGMLTSLGEKHPLLMMLVRSKMGIGI